MEYDIKEKFRLEEKIYFDLIFEDKLTVNHCFVEKGEYGDLLLRLPTKKTDKGVFQTVWFNDESFFKEIQSKLREKYKGEL